MSSGRSRACPFDEARGYGVYAYIALGELLRHRFREPDDARLCRSVVTLAEVTHLADDGGYGNNCAAVLGHEVEDGLGAVKDARKVRLYYLVPLLESHSLERPVAVDAGVVDENVDAAEVVLRGLAEALGLLEVRDVRPYRHTFAAELFDFLL